MYGLLDADPYPVRLAGCYIREAIKSCTAWTEQERSFLPHEHKL